jgi:hypothetical protein
LNGVQEAEGSNPFTPTIEIKKPRGFARFLFPYIYKQNHLKSLKIMHVAIVLPSKLQAIVVNMERYEVTKINFVQIATILKNSRI